MARSSTTKKPVTTPLTRLIKSFTPSFGKLDAEHKQLTRRMDELKRAGLVYATTFWRKKVRADGEEVRFLYLHYPAKGNKDRQRVYVGSVQAKIDAALAGIERAREYDEKAQEAQAIERRIESIAEALETAKAHLENKTPRWGYVSPRMRRTASHDLSHYA